MQKKEKVKRIFDDISKRYDLLNHLLSVGIDFYWRKKSLKLTEIKRNAKLLDVACGTGDFSIAAKKIGIEYIVGLDLSKNMLLRFRDKSEWANGMLLQGVAEEIPLKANSFSNITVGFGVRNFYSILEGFRSFYNILENQGKVTILEFRLPSNRIIKGLYNFYFNEILPRLGKLISKDKEAYTYLPESVSEFDKNINLHQLLTEAGFINIKIHSLTLGIVQVVIAEK